MTIEPNNFLMFASSGENYKIILIIEKKKIE